MKRNDNTSAGSIIDQIQGHMDLGMDKEAMRTVRKVLKSNPLDARVFQESLLAILAGCDKPKKFKARVYAAYERLDRVGRKLVQAEMLYFSYMVADYARAQKFIPARLNNARSLYIALNTFLKNGELEKAKKLTLNCERLLKRKNLNLDDFSRSIMLTALARGAERFCDLDLAEKSWLESLRLDQFLFRYAAEGLIKNHVARAWIYLWCALAKIEEFKGNVDSKMELQLPGNHDLLLKQAKKQLEAYRKILKKILPEKDLPQYGIERKLLTNECPN
jgi:hypothetical protein